MARGSSFIFVRWKEYQIDSIILISQIMLPSSKRPTWIQDFLLLWLYIYCWFQITISNAKGMETKNQKNCDILVKFKYTSIRLQLKYYLLAVNTCKLFFTLIRWIPFSQLRTVTLILSPLQNPFKFAQIGLRCFVYYILFAISVLNKRKSLIKPAAII